MKIREIFTANADEWGTPKEFFQTLDKEFRFTLDPCGDKIRLLKNGIKTTMRITQRTAGMKKICE